MAPTELPKRRPETRTLVRWTSKFSAFDLYKCWLTEYVAEIDIRLLLMVDSVSKQEGIKIPWDKVAKALGDKFTAGAIIQHLAKLRQKHLEADREARKEGNEPPTGLHELDRSGRKRAVDEPKTPTTPRKRAHTESANQAGSAEASSDEEWGSKKKKGAKATSSKKNKSVKKEQVDAEEYMPPSKNTRGVIKDYSKLVGNDDEEESENKSDIKEASEGDHDIKLATEDVTEHVTEHATEQGVGSEKDMDAMSSDSTIDLGIGDADEQVSPRQTSPQQIPLNHNMVEQSKIVTLPVRFNAPTTEAGIMNNHAVFNMPPPRDFARAPLNQSLDPWDPNSLWNAPYPTTPMPYSAEAVAFGGHGPPGYVGPNSMHVTPHQSMSSNSTSIVNSSQFTGIGDGWMHDLNDNMNPQVADHLGSNAFHPTRVGNGNGGNLYEETMIRPDYEPEEFLNMSFFQDGG